MDRDYKIPEDWIGKHITICFGMIPGPTGLSFMSVPAYLKEDMGTAFRAILEKGRGEGEDVIINKDRIQFIGIEAAISPFSGDIKA